jgi:hypothetical protein
MNFPCASGRPGLQRVLSWDPALLDDDDYQSTITSAGSLNTDKKLALDNESLAATGGSRLFKVNRSLFCTDFCIFCIEWTAASERPLNRLYKTCNTFEDHQPIKPCVQLTHFGNKVELD